MPTAINIDDNIIEYDTTKQLICSSTFAISLVCKIIETGLNETTYTKIYGCFFK